MAFDLSLITPMQGMRPPRILLLGVEKIGKTDFASRFPNPTLIPIIGEEGADDPGVQARCQVTPVAGSFTDCIGWLKALSEQTHDRQTAIVDSTSAFEPLVWDATAAGWKDKNGVAADNIEKVGGGYGKGFTAALDYWRAMTQWLDLLRSSRNMASILIGHVKVKRFDDPAGSSYDQYQFDIHDKAANLLIRWADLVLFANRKTVVTSEDIGFNQEKKRGIEIEPDARFLYTQKRPAHPGGGRGVFGRLPYELPLSYDAFAQAIANV